MRNTSISEEIREVIRRSGWTVYRVAKEAKVPASTIHRFMSGTGLSMGTLDKVAEVFDLHVTQGKPLKGK